VRRIMIKAMDARPDAAPDSRTKLTTELDWLDTLLADGRRFLAGDRFSHVDITVASLLAPFARPEQANVYSAMQLPSALVEDVTRWRERPIMEWVRSMYREHR
jgi:glutathione S-transferase